MAILSIRKFVITALLAVTASGEHVLLDVSLFFD